MRQQFGDRGEVDTLQAGVGAYNRHVRPPAFGGEFGQDLTAGPTRPDGLRRPAVVRHGADGESARPPAGAFHVRAEDSHALGAHRQTIGSTLVVGSSDDRAIVEEESRTDTKPRVGSIGAPGRRCRRTDKPGRGLPYLRNIVCPLHRADHPSGCPAHSKPTVSFDRFRSR